MKYITNNETIPSDLREAAEKVKRLDLKMIESILEYLGLFDCKMEKGALHELCKLKKLGKIGVSESCIDAEELKKENPDLEVITYSPQSLSL